MLAPALVLASGLLVGSAPARHGETQAARPAAAPASTTLTPIKHLVVIYPENESFDHYFGTYPYAANPPGEPAFYPAAGTPAVNGLTPGLLAHNPNGVNPRRLDRSEPFTCDNSHSYTGEQRAFHGGLMDRFVTPSGRGVGGCAPSSVMNYYDGNTVTALWNYAQRFAMSDNSYDATFGPTLLGHLNLVAGQTHGVVVSAAKSTRAVRRGTVIDNSSARYEDCTKPGVARLTMTGRNIGDLLSTGWVTWGYFSEGFRPTARRANGTAVCGATHRNLSGRVEPDYIAGGGTEPFQFWASTSNRRHRSPKSTAEIGHSGPANHQYDLSDFWSAAAAGRMPAVSFLKPAVYDNGHPATSDPLDEQRFLVSTINRIQQLPAWSSTAIVIAYDDSDGWYDHQMVPLRNASRDPAYDALSAPGICGHGPQLAGYFDRCGPGARQPLLVLSPYARRNAVDHTETTQVSITRFIEDNWLHGTRIGHGSFDASAGPLTGLFDFAHPDNEPLMLAPVTGLPANGPVIHFR